MDPRFSYETYQDVRNNVFKYSVVLLNVAGWAVLAWVVPPAVQSWLASLVGQLLPEPWKALVNTVGVLGVFALVAFALVELFKVHDRFYDKYIIRWRASYDSGFILPALAKPFAGRLDERFFKMLKTHREEFMYALWYPFVSDRDTKIGKNDLVRFYERVTIYWLTQMNELVVLVVIVAAGLGWALGPVTPEYRAILRTVTVVALLCGGLNRLWVRSSREGVREATAVEIEAVTTEHLPELERRLAMLCAKHAMAIAPRAAPPDNA